MLIKIKSCSAENFWYNDHIGKYFDVESNNELDCYSFILESHTYWIDKKDAEIVDLFYENILSDIKEKLTIMSNNLQAYNRSKRT
jgi:hypothetical protein